MIELKSSQQTTHKNNLQLRCNVTSCFSVYFFFFNFFFFLNWFEAEQFDAQHSNNNNNDNKKSDIKTAKKTVKIAFTLDVICKSFNLKNIPKQKPVKSSFSKFSSTNNRRRLQFTTDLMLRM